MIYLASPYSHPDAFVRERRFQAACEAAARLMQDGHHVFSPIAHSLTIAVHGVPTDWTYWKTFDSHMLAACGELAVLSRGTHASTSARGYLERHARTVVE
jgi:hypothetical protein